MVNLLIEDCRNTLEILDCSNNMIPFLNLDKFYYLRELDCSNNPFESKPENPLQNTLRLPEEMFNMKKLVCAGLGHVQFKLDLAHSNLEYLDASNNYHLKEVSLPRTIKEFYLTGDYGLFYLRGYNPDYNSFALFPNLEKASLKGCTWLKFDYKVNTATLQSLESLDISDSSAREVYVGGNRLSNFTTLKCGTPSRLRGEKVKLYLENYSWTKRWDEYWKDLEENAGTVMAYFMSGREVNYGEDTQMEVITNEDEQMRQDLGKFYNDFKKKLAPNARIIHVDAMKSVTEFDCSFSLVANLDNMIRWMPNLEKLNAAGNYIETADIAKHCPKLRELNLSQNEDLRSLTVPDCILSVDVSGSRLSSQNLQKLAAACSPTGVLIVKNWLPESPQNITMGGFTGLRKLVLKGNFKRLTVSSRIDSLECISSGDDVTILFPAEFPVFQFKNFVCSNNGSTVNLRFGHASSALHWYSELRRMAGSADLSGLNIEVYGRGEGYTRNILRFGSDVEVFDAYKRGLVEKGDTYFSQEGRRMTQLYQLFTERNLTYNPKYYREDSGGFVTFKSRSYNANYPTTVTKGDSRYDKSLDGGQSTGKRPADVPKGPGSRPAPTGGNSGTSPSDKGDSGTPTMVNPLKNSGNSGTSGNTGNSGTSEKRPAPKGGSTGSSSSNTIKNVGTPKTVVKTNPSGTSGSSGSAGSSTGTPVKKTGPVKGPVRRKTK